MLAYVLTSFGAPPELREVPVPETARDEVLVQVAGSSINPVDGQVASGFFRPVQEYRFPAVFGRDVSGVVTSVGADVRRLTVGQRVWGFVKRAHIGDGTFAEYVAVPEDAFVVPVPTGLSMLEAGAMGLSAVTALECLDVLGLQRGDTVFVNRATGGVGSFAVQIAAGRGLQVIATARPGEATDYVRGLGATAVVDWTGADLADQVRQHCPQGADGLVDLVRRDAAPEIGMDKTTTQREVRELGAAVLRPGGRLSTVTNDADDELVAKGLGFNVHSTPSVANLSAVNELVERHGLRVPITATYGLADIAVAFAHQEKAGRGKVAIDIGTSAIDAAGVRN